MINSRFFKIMAAAVILALLMLAIPIVPTIGATGTIIITNPATKTGPPGTAVTLTCTGFTGGQTYTVYFGATVVTSGSTVTGAFTAYFDVPSSPRGVYNVTVITTAPDDSNTVTYTVTPDVTANVSTANVGDTVTVSGTGFAASTSVTIYFDGVSEGTDTTNTTGNFTGFTFTVPATVEGTYIIEAEETYATSYYDTVNLEIDPKITINPTSGVVDDIVAVTGSGFDGTSTVTISFNGVSQTTAVTDANGTLPSTTFTVPEASRGNYTVKGQDTGGNYATATFTVSTSITINPASGPSGITVTVTGSGFAANQTITIKYNNVPVTTDPPTVTTNSAGYFTAEFDVPVGEAGTYVVQASDTSTNTAIANFESTTSATISQTTTATAPGYVGMSLTITGVGFTPDATITVTYATDPVTLNTVTAGPTGNFTATFTIPPSVGGAHTITVSDGTITRTFDFYMEENAPPTPTLASPAEGEKADSEAIFDWSTVQDVSPASNPVTYDLQVATSDSFSVATLIINETELEESTYTILPEDELESTGEDEPYYWRVRAVDAASNASAWSEVETFTVGWSFEFTGWVVWVTMVVVAAVFFFLGLWIGRRGGGGEYY